MTATPPFDPPYTMQDPDAPGRWLAVHADGTRTDTPAPAALRVQAADAVKTADAAKPPSPRRSSAAAVLNVPFAEKEDAKRLGAKWDAAKKKWYVPQGVDVDAFSRWM